MSSATVSATPYSVVAVYVVKLASDVTKSRLNIGVAVLRTCTLIVSVPLVCLTRAFMVRLYVPAPRPGLVSDT